MPGDPKKIPRPVLVGHFETKIKQNIGVALAISMAGSLWWWWGYIAPRKRKYAEYRVTHDIHEEFKKIASTGAFDSVAPDGGVGKKKP
ncbi:hypothetical protein ILUMI_17572 [Ignelater luminosus]|uniref:Mitochondrial cytochrome c oxidase subunit VIc/VIIs domain-containing protein n=1 Tax=Ignelater luminosus TaxID=2038154 RepID=A0A8K0G7E3_IGNLU|nr:hypothetical protein ILUMI_17572 [Ignelater luminosus]